MAQEGLPREVDAALTGGEDGEGRVLRRQRGDPGPGAGEEEQAIVGDFGEGRATRLGTVPQRRLVTRSKARTMAQRRIPKWCREQVVQPRRTDRRRLRSLEELLEQYLLLGGIDQLAGGELMLRLDDAPRPEPQRAELRVARASRPDSGRHRRAPPRW